MKRISAILVLPLLLACSCSTGPSLEDRTGIKRGNGVKTITISYATDPENAILDLIDSPMERKQLLTKARFLNRHEKVPAGTSVTFDRLVDARESGQDYSVYGHLRLGGRRVSVVIRSSALAPIFGIGG